MFLHYRKNGVGDRRYYDYLSRPSNRHSDFNLIFVFFSKCCVGRMSYSGIECDGPEVTCGNYLGILLFYTEKQKKSSNDDFTMKKCKIPRTYSACARTCRGSISKFSIQKFSLISHSEFVLNQVRFHFFRKSPTGFEYRPRERMFPSWLRQP